MRALAVSLWCLGLHHVASGFVVRGQGASYRARPRVSADSSLVDIKEEELQLRARLRELERLKTETLARQRLRIGIVGFGNFGQFLANAFSGSHDVSAMSRSKRHHATASAMGLSSYFTFDDAAGFFAQPLDVVVFAVSIVSFESTIARLREPLAASTSAPLLVDVLSVKEHPQTTLLAQAPAHMSILCTHPMFGPESGRFGWQDLPLVYDRVRLFDEHTDVCERFLSVFEQAGCKMVDMPCSKHDE